jgi:hypothetical protein
MDLGGIRPRDLADGEMIITSIPGGGIVSHHRRSAVVPKVGGSILD